MKNKGFVLICDVENEQVKNIQTELDNDGFSVELIHDAADLVPNTIRLRPGVLIVNPDMPAFNAYDVCKNLMNDLDIPVIMMVEKTSVTRAQIGDCQVDDVVTKPVEIKNLIHLISKHMAISQ